MARRKDGRPRSLPPFEPALVPSRQPAPAPKKYIAANGLFLWTNDPQQGRAFLAEHR